MLGILLSLSSGIEDPHSLSDQYLQTTIKSKLDYTISEIVQEMQTSDGCHFFKKEQLLITVE